MKDVAGKLVLVTGGAMGMGKLTALRFARAGSKIILVDLNEKELKNAAAEIKAKGAEVWTFVQNVTDRAGVYRLADSIAKKIGTVDILINSAGIVIGGPILKTDDEKIRLHYEVNVLGTIYFMKAFLPGMIKKGAGHVLNFASASGFVGVPYLAAYASSKWAVIGITESVRLEMREEGHKKIGFTSFCPLYVATGMFEGVKPVRTTKLLEPEKMAEIVFNAVRKGKILVKVPFLVKTTPMLTALTPKWFSDWMLKVLGASDSAHTWKGHGLPPGLDKSKRPARKK